MTLQTVQPNNAEVNLRRREKANVPLSHKYRQLKHLLPGRGFRGTGRARRKQYAASTADHLSVHCPDGATKKIISSHHDKNFVEVHRGQMD